MRRLLLIAIALLLGLGTAEMLYQTPAAREAVRRTGHRALAWLARAGIYGSREALQEIARLESLQRLAQVELVSEAEIEHEIHLLRSQFADENIFARAERASGFTPQSLRAEIAAHLRNRQWLEKQIGPRLKVTGNQARRFYEAQRAQFAQPPRYRARHVFLAAPAGTPADVATVKQSAIQGLAVRILAGETLETVAADASEDEASKAVGGDLGYFSSWRMAPEFMAEIEKLKVGEISAPFRTPLGFHIVQLTDLKSAHELSFEEARVEVVMALANKKRATAVEDVAASLNASHPEPAQTARDLATGP